MSPDPCASSTPEFDPKRQGILLFAEEMSLRDSRQALTLTQERMAEQLGIGQEGISRLEKRSDLLISTLRDYVEAMGGTLRFVAEFPDRPPVCISGIVAVEAEKRRKVAPKTRRERG